MRFWIRVQPRLLTQILSVVWLQFLLKRMIGVYKFDEFLFLVSRLVILNLGLKSPRTDLIMSAIRFDCGDVHVKEHFFSLITP